MRVTVLGGSGFIGRCVCELLYDRKIYTVLAVSRSIEPESFGPKRARLQTLQFDVSGVADVPLDIFTSDMIVDLASVGPTAESLNAIVNVSKAARRHVDFIRQCIKRGFNGRYVYVSSGGAIYGNPEQAVVKESHSTYPLSPYGYEKLLIETHLLREDIKNNLDLIILRPGNVYGPGQVAKRGFGIVPTIYKLISNSQPLTIYGDGSEGQRDYVFESDCAAAIEAAILAPQLPAAIYNISTGRGISTLGIAQKIAEVLGVHPIYSFVPPRETDVSKIALDWSRAEEDLGWRPLVTFEEGIAQTITRWRKRA